MRRCVSAVCVAAALAMALPAGAMMVDVPLPGLVVQSDLVVQAKVVKSTEPAEVKMIVPELNYGGRPSPDADKPADVLMRGYTVNIEKIYRDAAGKVKAEDAVDLVTRAQPPAPPPQPGQPMIFVSDGPMYIQLKEGESYLLLLRARPDGKGYYLPNYFKCFAPAAGAEQRLPGFEQAVAVDKWNWSDADKSGLQLAVLVNEPITAKTSIDRATKKKLTPVQVMIALRNTGKEKQTVTVNGDIRCLSLQFVTTAGVAIKPAPDLYAGMTKTDPRSLPPIEVAPGAIVLISPYGPAMWWQYLQTELPAGDYQLTATYEVTREQLPKSDVEPAADREKPEAPALWAGKLVSKPTPFTVKPNPMPVRGQPS
ncbi:MAG: hypothetical protein BIFFINMI_01427 [Phycisphaerae bacterium]|nr:hypothetical protein [Phycisphaerae bacterium]